jgi:hypothetical protein
MKRLPAALALALILLLTAAASTALAHGNYARGGWDSSWYDRHDWDRHDRAVKCNGTFTGVTIRDHVLVPRDGTCTLIDATVQGDVEVRTGAYFQATGTSIRGGVEGNEALTVFIDGGSRVGGSVSTNETAQVSLFDSTIAGLIGIYRSDDSVNVCGNTVRGVGIGIARSGQDILVGDPLAVSCAANRVTRGSVLLWRNSTDVSFVVRGNSIPKGSLHVLGNKGSSDKFVQRNTGRRTIRCTGNLAPFLGSPNFRWDSDPGQCNG